MTAYWRGHVPGQGLSILYGAISIGLYQTIWYYTEHKGFGFSNTRTKSAVADLLIGTGAAVPATVLSYPFDVIRTRIVCQSPKHTALKSVGSKRTVYTGTIDAFIRISSIEGWKALFKGLPAALYTVPVYNGLSLCMYNTVKPLVSPYMTKIDKMNIPILSDVATGLLGGMSGFITKTIVFPMDTIKKRLQVQGFAEGRAEMGITPQYRSFWHCLVTIFRDEGVRNGLFKGWLPGAIKAFPNGVVQFIFLERSMYFVGRARKRAHDKTKLPKYQRFYQQV